MAVRTTSFEIAAFDVEAKKKGEQRFIELQHGGGRFSLWRTVSQGQFGRFTVAINRGAGIGRIGALDDFLQKIMLEPDEVRELAEAGETDVDGIAYSARLEDGAIAVGSEFLWDAFEAGAFKDEHGEDTLNPIYQMIGAVMRESTGFPTEPLSGSTSTPRASGPRSTATSRRQGSSRSTSRRAGSPA